MAMYLSADNNEGESLVWKERVCVSEKGAAQADVTVSTRVDPVNVLRWSLKDLRHS